MNASFRFRPLALFTLWGLSVSTLLSADKAHEPVVIPDLALTLQWVAPGSLPGAPADDASRAVKEGFWLSKTELTQLQWKTITGNNPSRYFKDDHPVQQVSWLDCLEYCELLSKREKEAGRLPEGYFYTLPTELQWEYAARAGDESDGSSTCDAQGWTEANSKARMQQVATKEANAWGFFDMRGNVWEFCQETPGTTPKGRFVRGGSSRTAPVNCAFTSRMELSLHNKNLLYGLRLALSKDRLVKPKDIPPPEASDTPPPNRSQRPAPVPTPTPTPTPPPVLNLSKTTQIVGGIEIKAARLTVIFEDTKEPVNRRSEDAQPSPAQGPVYRPAPKRIIIDPATGKSRVVNEPLTGEKEELKEKILKALKTTMPGKHVITRAGMSGTTHEDSFREIAYYATYGQCDAILWVTDMENAFTASEIEALSKVLKERKVALYMITTKRAATDDSPYRRDSSVTGRLLIDMLRQSGGNYRNVKLKP